jgi:DNA-binding transcriptional ArsR family regulator
VSDETKTDPGKATRDVAAEAGVELRQLDDPRIIRALAHPVRLALMEALLIHEQLTATEAGEILGESPANCSFHLRKLAKYGFVEEAGGGQGRQRPWRRKTQGTRLSINDSTPPETAIAVRGLGAMFQERALERLRQWRATEAQFPNEWREAADSKQSLWWVTPAELHELNEKILKLVLSYAPRLADPTLRPPGSAPVEFLSFAYPLQLPTESGTPDVPSGDSDRRTHDTATSNEGDHDAHQ